MKLPASILLPATLLLLLGCTSTKPPAAVSPLREQAQRTLTSAREAYARENWTSAAQLFGRAAESFAAVDDAAAQADALHNQGQSLQRANLIETAVEAYEQAADINERLHRDVEQAQNLTGLAQCAAAQQRLDLAIETSEQALKLAGKTPAIRATIENDLAVHLLERGRATDRDRVLALLASALNTNQQLRNAPGVAVNDLNFGRAHFAFGQLELAEAQLARALLEFRTLDDVRGLAQTHELLASVYAKRGDSARAKVHRQQALDKYAFLKDEAAMKRLMESK